MKFTETGLAGAYVIDIRKIQDERGFFARAWCHQEFEAQGLNTEDRQCNLAQIHKRGTLRGMHYQVEPHAEDKLVRCIHGAIYDVMLDLRTNSPTYGQWKACELSRENRRMLFIPKGFAHGYQALTDDAEVLYEVSADYHPAAEKAVRCNDPAFGIEWPISPPTVISDKDSSIPDFEKWK